jgi:hypothetical protein
MGKVQAGVRVFVWAEALAAALLLTNFLASKKATDLIVC